MKHIKKGQLIKSLGIFLVVSITIINRAVFAFAQANPPPKPITQWSPDKGLVQRLSDPIIPSVQQGRPVIKWSKPLPELTIYPSDQFQNQIPPLSEPTNINPSIRQSIQAIYIQNQFQLAHLTQQTRATESLNLARFNFLAQQATISQIMQAARLARSCPRNG